MESSIEASTKEIEHIQDNFSAVLEYDSSNNTSEKKITPCTDDAKSENKNSCDSLVESSIVTTNALSITDENVEETRGRTDERGEKQTTKHADTNTDDAEKLISPEMPRKSVEKKENKTRKRVHFKSEVETLMYESRLSICEYTDEFSLENVFADVFNERRTLPGGISSVPWKSEMNLAYSRPCNQCSIMEEWVRCEHGFRRLKREHIPVRHYTRLNDEDIGVGSKKERKVKPILKRSGSYLITKKESENGHPSGNLKRRLSMSMHNLKSGMESMTDKFMAKVTKKKIENVNNPLWVHAGNTTDALMEEFKSLPRLKRTDTLLGKENGEGEDETPCALSGNGGLRRWMSMHTLKKENSPVLESSEFNTDNSYNNPEKGWTRMKKMFGKKKHDAKKESSTMYTKPGLRSWMSMQH